MSKFEKCLLYVGLILLVVVISSFRFSNPQEVAASVNQGNEYQSTTTDASFASAFSGLKYLPSSTGALGSVVITTAGNSAMTIYDGTTTDATKRGNTATTTLASIPVPTNGTYTFDSIVRYGIIVQTTGTNVSSSTITYR